MEAIRKWFSALTISTGGVNDTLNGQIYQVELLMFIMQNAQIIFETFGLSTELKEFECFDDAILHTKDTTIAIQAKWRKNAKPFTFSSFFSASKDNDFSLYKYIISGMKIFEKFQDTTKVAICTNNTFPDGDVIELINAFKTCKIYVSKVVNSDRLF
jgi:hypothetical protein